MKHLKLFEEIDFTDEDWEEFDEKLYIYELADTGMEGNDWDHVKYVLAKSRKEAGEEIGWESSARKVTNSKSVKGASKTGNSTLRYKGGKLVKYHNVRTDEQGGYEIEKKKLEKEYKKVKKKMENFNDVFNKWKTNRGIK